MTQTSQKAKLLELFEKTRRVLHTFASSRSDAQKAEVGTFQNWAAKDVLANSAFWMRYMVERMAIYARNERPPRHVNFEVLTQKAFEDSQTCLWQAIVDDVQESLNRLISEVTHFTDEQLNIHNVYGDVSDENPGGPLWGEIQANGFICPLQDIEKFYVRTGDAEAAKAVNTLLRDAIAESPNIVVDLIQAPMLRKQQEDDARVMIIDVRSAKDYAAGHVQGAVNISMTTLAKRLNELPQSELIVTYCNMHQPGQSRGEQAAALLRDKGYRVKALEGGFPGWKDAGFPVEELSDR